jgi:hypothetical protein
MLQSATSPIASLSFCYICDALMHRLFYDRLWGTQFTAKATAAKFKVFEQTALAILQAETKFGDSISTFSQPYLFALVRSFTKTWNTTYELTSATQDRDRHPPSPFTTCGVSHCIPTSGEHTRDWDNDRSPNVMHLGSSDQPPNRL